MNAEQYGNKGADSCVGTIIDDKTIVTAAYLGCLFFNWAWLKKRLNRKVWP